MKLKLLIGAAVVIGGLYFINRSLNEAPKYMQDASSAATPAAGEVRQEMIVGFLPVT